MICCRSALAYFTLFCLSLYSACASELAKPIFFVKQRETDTVSQMHNEAIGNSIKRIRYTQSNHDYKVKEAINYVIMKLFLKDNYVESQGIDENLSKGCWKAVGDIAIDIVSRQDYSKLKIMLDADGRPGSGINEGNLNWLGSYRECTETSFAHFCVSKVNIFNKNYPVTIGLCVPKECTSSDVLAVLTSVANFTHEVMNSPILKVLGNTSFIEAAGSTVYCDEVASFSTGNIVAFCIAGLFVGLVLVGTVIDYLRRCTTDTVIVSKTNNFMPVQYSDDSLAKNVPVNESQPFLAQNDVKKSHGSFLLDIFVCFSLKKNAAQILNTNVLSSAISSLNGIRTISMFWVILGHTFFFALYAPSDNPVEGFKFIRRFTFQAIANAYFSVDTFFLLSGLLVSYLSLKRLNNYTGESFRRYVGKTFLPQFYLHRFLRLTPAYMFIILFYIYIFPFCGRGPLWFQQAKGTGIENCKKYWWTNLLYISNFYPQHMYSECVGWSWYLANDMQFYVISPLIIFAMYWLHLPGTVLVNSFICLASFCATGLIIGTNNLNALLTGDFQEATGDQTQKFADLVYSKPYSRIPPYLVGLALGYIIYYKKQPKRSIGMLVGFVGWTVSIGIALSVTYGPYTVFKYGGQPFTLIENILYGTFSRFSWALCVGWVVYACHFGLGGAVNSLLSWRAFIPLSRLTYSAYLIHPIVIQVFYSSFETPLHFSDIVVAYYFASFVVITYASAFLLAVCIEFPMSNLEKLVFQY